MRSRSRSKVRRLLLLAFGAWLVIGLAQANRPDIQVTTPLSVDPPAVEQGDPVEITATVANIAAVAVDESFDVVFRIRADGEERILGADELSCLTFPSELDPSRCTVPGLAAVGQDGDRFDIKAGLDTSLLGSGQFTIIAEADPEDKIAEANEANNTAEGLLLVRPRRPNLTVLATFTLSPERPRQGDLITVEFTVENDRPADINVPFRIGFALRNRSLGEIEFRELLPPALSCPELKGFREACTLPGLEANSRVRIRAQIVTLLLEPGEYQLRITVDPDEAVANEADRTDNILTIDFALGLPPLNLSFIAGRLEGPPRPGGPAAFTFTLLNQGFAAVTGVELGLTLLRPGTAEALDPRDLPGFACGPRRDFEPDRDQCAPTAIEPGLKLGPNEALEVLVRFSTETLEPGGYELRAKVDPQGKIDETDEEDNTLTLAFVVPEPGEIPQPPQAAAELHPIGITFTPGSPILKGEKVLVSALINNSGTRDAEQFRVEFFARREDQQGQSFELFGTQTINGLRLGTTIEAKSVLDTAGLEPGLYAIKVVVNPLGQSELDPANNALIAFITIIEAEEGSQ
jgi:hypothetical protein